MVTRDQAVAFQVREAALLEEDVRFVEEEDWGLLVGRRDWGPWGVLPQFHFWPRWRTVLRYVSTASGLVPTSPQVTL
jgi:hypothetical protein